MKKNKKTLRLVAVMLTIALCIPLLSTGVVFAAGSDYQTLLNNPDQAISENYWAELERDDSVAGKIYPKYLMKLNETCLKALPNQLNFKDSPSTGVYKDFNTLFYSGNRDMFQWFSQPEMYENYGGDNGDPSYQEYNGKHYHNPFGFSFDTDFIKNQEQLNVYGDISINDNSGNAEIASYNLGENLNLKFTVDLSNVSKFRNIKFWTQINGNSKGMNWKTLGTEGYCASDYEIVFVLNLPQGVTIPEDASVTVNGLASASANIERMEDGKVLIKLHKNQAQDAYMTAKEYYTLINGIKEVSVNVDKLYISDNVAFDKNVTITGSVVGVHDQVQTDSIDIAKNKTDEGSTSNEKTRSPYFFVAKQSEAGRDAAAPEDKPNLISYTFKVEQPKPLPVLTITPKDVTGYVGGVSASGNSAPTLRFELTKEDGTAVTDLTDWTLTMHLTDDKTVDTHSLATEWTMTPEPAQGSSFYLLPTLELGLNRENNVNHLTGDFLQYTHVEDTGSAAGHYKIELVDEDKWYITATNGNGDVYKVDVQPGNAQITSRYVHDDTTAYQIPSSMLNKVVTSENDVKTLYKTDDGKTVRRLVAVIPEGANFYTNGKSSGLGLTGAFGHGYLENEATHENKPLIALLFDETVSLSSDADDEVIESAMMQYAKAQNEKFAFDGWQYRFRYLDLVNVNDGNAWVSCDRDITVYWPYPEEVLERVDKGENLDTVLKDYDFQILHFAGMERENYKSWQQNITCTVENVSVTPEAQGLKFVLPANDEGHNMSPFALMWKEKAVEPTPRTYTVTYTDGVDNEEIFKDQVTADIQEGAKTPAFKGTPTRKGYTFKGWTPAVAQTVTADATYTATWEKVPEDTGKPTTPTGGTQNQSPATGDNSHMALWLTILAVSGAALIGTLFASKRRKTNK